MVVAGSREAETALARAISDGTVYRFIHKPMSPGRARLFADAAVRRYAEQRKRRRRSGQRRRPKIMRLLIGAACVALCVLLGVIWLLRHSTHDAVDARKPLLTAPPAPPTETPLLARAADALAANRLTAPGGDGALDLYLQALTLDPADTAARAGMAEVRERSLARAQNALLEERLDEASVAIETARKAGAEGGRLALLSAQLAKAREQLKAPPAAARTNAAELGGGARGRESRRTIGGARRAAHGRRDTSPSRMATVRAFTCKRRCKPTPITARPATPSRPSRCVCSAATALERIDC